MSIPFPLSAPYEPSATGPPGYDEVGELADALVRQAPERMLWASNWPHPGRATLPGTGALVEVLATWAGDEATMHRILVENPARLLLLLKEDA